ncbi:PaaI family thioesterase [Endozoicomonas numazuensis]|uniref:PaaI family thioesterase n=1 Tax=Endozoicomonas numazuensis TaxID=1137799 RepID=UPI000ACC1C0D|nr:PaaI family thioesterase [Endozoicomonas numazuensis]
MPSKYYPFDSETLKEPLDDVWAARREAADATRRLIENLVNTQLSAQELQKLASRLSEEADRLEQGSMTQGRFDSINPVAVEQRVISELNYELNPVEGKSNPLAPPIQIWMDDEGVYGKATLGWQYEGPPSTVHGGYVAALFDQFLGIGQKLTGHPGVTGQLSVKYLKPTPLNTELNFIGRLEKSEGRRIVMTAEILANGVITAKAECVFIRIDAETFKRMKEGSAT